MQVGGKKVLITEMFILDLKSLLKYLLLILLILQRNSKIQNNETILVFVCVYVWWGDMF